MLGNVTRQNICHPEAPSDTAASSSSLPCDCTDALAAFEGTVVLHCFSSPELVRLAAERRYYVSFAGNVTYPRADALRAAAVEVPHDRILIETDSPYLAPQGLRGTANEPANVIQTTQVLAAVREESFEELAAATHANAAAAFGLS